jgi:YebC/PmpR family DNA-binding regulatory protein
MAGHSHSANIKHRKDRVNALKAKVFSKIARMIIVAAKLGGGDPDANPRLRLALEKARAASMPKDNVNRAIKKGIGGTEGADYVELLYEGYGAGGVALLIDILTDNRNRTAPEIRKIFEKAGGNLATSGAVAYMFQRKSIYDVEPQEELDEDRLMESVLESGAEDLVESGGVYRIYGDPGNFIEIREALDAQGVSLTGAAVGYAPDTTVEVTDVEVARKIVRILEALEENDDVQGVFSNHAFSEEVADQLAEGV